MSRSTPGRARHAGRPALKTAALPIASAVLALGMLAPILRPGFVLVYDMVFADGPALLPDTLGLGSALPRAVPADAIVAALSLAVPGEVLQKAVLIGAVFAAALGAGRLVPTSSTGVRLVAAAAYGWNAYVAERLFIGHWGLLVAYAALPWVAAAGLAWRRGARPGWVALVLACAPAVITPTGGLLSAAVALVTVGRRRLLATGAVVVTLNAPWLMPALLHPGRSAADPAGAAVFGARAEGPGGPLISLLGLGGIWNADTVPASRAGALVPLVTVVLTAAAVFGTGLLARRWGRAPVLGLGLLAAVGLLVALSGTLAAAAEPLRWATAHVPGFGLLRDGQKWMAWWALLSAPALALAAQWCAARTGGAASRRVVLGALALVPVAVLPDLAAGGAGRLRPVAYPADYDVVRGALADSAAPGDVLALPLSTYRRFSWNDDRTQLDPAGRVLPRRVVSDDSLRVGGTVVRGEDARVERVRRAVRDGTPLGTVGIGWVLIAHHTPGPAVPATLLAGATVVHDGPWLSLYRVSGPITATDGGPPAGPVLAAHAAAAALVTAALIAAALGSTALIAAALGCTALAAAALGSGAPAHPRPSDDRTARHRRVGTPR